MELETNMLYLPCILIIGIGATATTDLWAIVRRFLLGVPAPDYAMVGRWLAHMPAGRFRHERIAAARAAPGERLIGWVAHYLIGIAFAATLIGVTGPARILRPELIPALCVGIATVAAPLLVMQPGMGAGIAASRTPQPVITVMQSLANHAVFGVGLYLGGLVANALLT
ncbi:MAG: DUF2938 domain-containing protein [Steroidobacteraceae bacterium]